MMEHRSQGRFWTGTDQARSVFRAVLTRSIADVAAVAGRRTAFLAR
jgi:hypothetical protein